MPPGLLDTHTLYPELQSLCSNTELVLMVLSKCQREHRRLHTHHDATLKLYTLMDRGLRGGHVLCCPFPCPRDRESEEQRVLNRKKMESVCVRMRVCVCAYTPWFQENKLGNVNSFTKHRDYRDRTHRLSSLCSPAWDCCFSHGFFQMFLKKR